MYEPSVARNVGHPCGDRTSERVSDSSRCMRLGTSDTTRAAVPREARAVVRGRGSCLRTPPEKALLNIMLIIGANARRCRCSATGMRSVGGLRSAVNVRAVVDPHDQGCFGGLVDTDEDAVVATARTAVTREFILQWLTQPDRVLRQRAGDELDNSSRDLIR